MNNKYCIYTITNILNNKIYVGKTKADTSRRWSDHIRMSLGSGKKQYIHRAMSKYGIDNFTNGKKISEIARLINSGRKIISAILNRKTYKHVYIDENILININKILLTNKLHHHHHHHHMISKSITDLK